MYKARWHCKVLLFEGKDALKVLNHSSEKNMSDDKEYMCEFYIN